MKSTKMMYKRILAFVLALVLMGSTFSSASVSAYATTGADIPVEVQTVEDTQEETVEEAEDEATAEKTEVVVEDTEGENVDTEDAVDTAVDDEAAEEDEANVEDDAATEDNAAEEDDAAAEEQEIIIEETTEVVAEEVELFGDEVIEPMTYTGTVQDDGTLWISSYEMEQAGMNFDDDALLEVIEANADNEFSFVSVDYPDNTISSEVWNAACGLVPEEGATIKYNIMDATTPMVSWEFYEPVESSDEIALGCTFTVGASDKGYTVQFDNTSFPASVLQVNFSMSSGMDGYENFVNAPAEGDMYIVTDEDGELFEPASVAPSEGDDYYNFTLSPIDKFQSGVKYTINRTQYTGKVYSWDDGQGNTCTGLEIMPDQAGKESFTNDEIITILKKNSGKKFNEIYIRLPYSENNVINGTVVNTAAGYMAAPSENNESNLVFVFDNDAGFGTQFCLINPKSGNGTGDYAASAKVSVSANDISVCIDACPDLKVDRIDTYYNFTISTSEAQNLIAMLGTDYTKLEISDTDTWANYGSGEYSAWIYLGNASSLETGKEYTIQEYVYYGDVETWEENGETFDNLSIHPWALDKSEFTETELLEILAERAKTGEKFNEIFIEGACKDDGGVISKSVANAAAALLKDDVDYRSLTFSYWFGVGSMDWHLINPGTMETDVNVDASLSVSANKIIVSKDADETALKADRVNVSLNYSRDVEKATALLEAFEESGNVLGVYSGTEEVTRAYYESNDEAVWVTIDDTSLLTSDVNYELRDCEYLGNVYEDETGKVLEIHYSGLLDVGEEWSPQVIADIIASYGDEKFSQIIVGVPGHAPDEEGNLNQWPGGDPENTIIYSAICKAAAKQLANKNQGLTYRIYYEESIAAWQFTNPSAITKDLQMNYTLGINEFGRPSIIFNLPALSKTIINLNINLLEGTEFTDSMVRFLGDEDTADTYFLYPTEKVSMPFIWQSVDINGEIFYKQIHLDNIGTLKNGVEYVVNPNRIGHASEEVWNEGEENQEVVQTLHINSAEYGHETFTSALLQEYLGAWKTAIENEEQAPFNVITIEQKSTDSDVIRKADYNYLLNLLADSGTKEINFVFDSSVDECIDEETDTWDWYQNQVYWSFPDPVAATADMKVGLNLTPSGAEGLKLKTAKVTYPSSGVNVQYMVDSRLPIVSSLKETLGEAPVEGEESTRTVIFSDVAKLNKVDSEAWYWQHAYTDENTKQTRTVYNIMVDNAQKLPATECTGYPVFYVGEYYVGQNLVLAPNKVAAEGAAITWKSFDTNIGTFDGSQLSLVNEGELLYAATFKDLEGKQTAEVYSSYVGTRLLYMDFVNVPTVSGNRALTMELPSKDAIENYGAESRDYLDLRFFPDNAGVDLEHQEWTTSDESIVEFVTSYVDENEDIWDKLPDGEIRALKPGTATITVKCKDEEGNYITDSDGNVISASCIVTVESSAYDEFEAKRDELIGGYGVESITNYEKTLADVTLPEGLEWKAPATSLAEFKAVYNFEFPAVYTAENGRKADVMVPVVFNTIEGIEVHASDENDQGFESGVVMEDGATLYFYDSVTTSVVWTDVETVNNWLEKTGNPYKLSVSYDKALTYDEEKGCYSFTADAAKSGKKTFKISLIETDTRTGKSKTLKTENFTVTVAKNKVADFDELYVDKDVTEGISGVIGEKGIYYFGLPADSQFKLTVKNLNTAVSKWGTVSYENKTAEITDDEGKVIGTEEYYCACVPYEIVGEGSVRYSLTANDEVKSSVTHTGVVVYSDFLPKTAVTTVTIDRNWTDERKEVEILLQMEEGTTFATTEFITEDFSLSFSNDGKVILTPEDYYLDKGKYVITADVSVVTPVTGEDGEAVKITYPFKITVNVTDKLPSVTVKQTEKVNLFYFGEQGSGALKVTSDTFIEGVIMEPQGAGEDEEVYLDFELCDDEDYDGEYPIMLYDEEDGKDKKATLWIYLAGYETPVQKKITIGTVNKAPTLVLSSKSDTYYINYGKEDEFHTYLTFTDKSTGEKIENIDFVTLKSGREYVELPTDVTIKNNTYSLESNFDGVSFTLIDVENAKKATDKFEFYVTGDNWNKSIKVSYSIKVDTSVPKLELGSKNITMNRHDDVYAQQLDIVDVMLKGSSRAITNENYEISITGADAKSNLYKATDLILYERWDEYGFLDGICVKLNKNTIPKGNYKYNIALRADGLPTLTTQLTVKVVDDAASKCITVSGKGSIDLLDRGDTSVAYTAKLKNVHGTVVGGYLTGTDADMFWSYGNENGQLVVGVYEEADYSTKYNYKVTPVFIIQNEEGGQYQLEGKEQSIKLKQGKPKVTISAPEGNTLYRGRNNKLVLDVSAIMNKTDAVFVEDIELTNYTDTFGCEFDYESDKLYIWQFVDSQEFIASGKSISLKFNVYYYGQAVNEKPATATFKMVVQ